MSSSQHRFMKSKTCQSNLISFSDRETDLVWMKIVGLICLKFCKAFDFVSEDILINKLRISK